MDYQNIDWKSDIIKAEEAFNICFSKNVFIIEALGNTYPTLNVDNMESYIAHRCVNIHAMFGTFKNAISTHIDVLSANSFLRIFADHISTLILIYETENIEERALRHYLYVADGIEEEMKVLEELEGRPSIDETGKQLVRQEKKNKQAIQQHCIDSIRRLPLYQSYKTIIDGLINGNKNGIGKYNWKYKDLESYEVKRLRECSYSYTELYADKLSLPSVRMKNLAQYIHGLAGSVMVSNGINVEEKIKLMAQYLIMSFSRFLWTKYKSLPSPIESNFLFSLVPNL